MSEDGEFYFGDTGDPLLDKWEAEFAQGLMPDLEEGLSSQARKDLHKERETIQRARGAAAELAPSSPEAQPADPRFTSKFVTPGSREEQTLIQKRAQQQILGSGRTMDDWVDLLGKE